VILRANVAQPISRWGRVDASFVSNHAGRENFRPERERECDSEDYGHEIRRTGDDIFFLNRFENE
jgi:hypothetical protein